MSLGHTAGRHKTLYLREAQRAQLQKALDGLAKKQESVLEQAMNGDPDDAFTKALRGRYNDLEVQRADLAAKLAAVDESDGAEPDKPSAEALSILDALPYLAKAPEDLLRTLFEVVQLGVQVHDQGEHATMTITLPADQVSEVADTAERIGDQMNPQGTPEGRAGGVLDRAPGEIPAAITPIVLPDGLLIRVDVRLVMERRPRWSVR
ncbi:hypothetical protein OG738_27190 [Amycolatopsis sp. NBC_01488]|uniref:hypothetical protein n=1 Tax=Amycolatopsis sp. NBC_01488 TaxID=2903563 RepID=UPI002E2DEEDD|nr:hypothetical protein [Amycolatopsis sp. NBC_01488]